MIRKITESKHYNKYTNDINEIKDGNNFIYICELPHYERYGAQQYNRKMNEIPKKEGYTPVAIDDEAYYIKNNVIGNDKIFFRNLNKYEKYDKYSYLKGKKYGKYHFNNYIYSIMRFDEPEGLTNQLFNAAIYFVKDN